MLDRLDNREMGGRDIYIVDVSNFIEGFKVLG